MEQIYVKEGTRRFPCTLEYMLQFQGTDLEPFTLVVRDEEEADYWNGMRFVTGHKLVISTIFSDIVNVLDPKTYFTFPEEETVYDGVNDCWRFRKYKS